MLRRGHRLCGSAHDATGYSESAAGAAEASVASRLHGAFIGWNAIGFQHAASCAIASPWHERRTCSLRDTMRRKNGEARIAVQCRFRSLPTTFALHSWWPPSATRSLRPSVGTATACAGIPRAGLFARGHWKLLPIN